MTRAEKLTEAEWAEIMKEDWDVFRQNDQHYQEAVVRGWIKDGQIQRIWAAGFKAGTGAFDLRWDADMRAIKRWQAEKPGRDLTWPDHADLVIWLLGERDKLMARLERDHAFQLKDGVMTRIEKELDDDTDGIACRDATIRELEEQLGRKKK